jgi:hypothetical protein
MQIGEKLPTPVTYVISYVSTPFLPAFQLCIPRTLVVVVYYMPGFYLLVGMSNFLRPEKIQFHILVSRLVSFLLRFRCLCNYLYFMCSVL